MVATVPLMTSVCTGALVHAAAGLLAGRPATTHWESLDLLAPTWIPHLVARLAGVGRTREVRRAIQSDPHPPV